ncbi:phenylalanine 4-monooxygenase [Cyclobacterium sp. 1_MG-2023]|uniref:phenylalanine 4-monooxygenase n=1 Tax=Cyclobacterium sp. 1_MG-2023 TaxID=3062681 RepID=UPI0026E2ED0D|nr:phenylalanine 4-monooxygenase [Cyclobacterium sp. 1_MG-2023]MDO6437105.1 phenylalanine 4-monooxygenase [Cyclobacterium sp. 1_MG-2023]
MKNIRFNRIFTDPGLGLFQQDIRTYNAEDFKVWETLFKKQSKKLPTVAAQEYIDGFKSLRLSEEKIVNLKEVSYRLGMNTGWRVQVVPGRISDSLFFSLLQAKKFPVTSWLRRLDELDYPTAPDLFHDAFGHLPLLMNESFSQFLQGLATITERYRDNPLALELLERVYWYTVEFGLIREKNGLRVYGAGILSSSGEMYYSLSDEPKHCTYEVEAVLNTPFWKNKFQDRYFIVNSFDELRASLPLIEEKVDEILQKAE